ncbi:aminophospholipid-transporting P-type ATPase [Amylocystis lapponica]|nr:aminophospholipid-transporting P-type ATPase [Amylocystis lapponica]
MKREMTKEDKELAAAGYEHLEEKAKGKKGVDPKLDNVDIEEHHLSFHELGPHLETSIDTKDAAGSYGLTSAEAKERLVRDGPNVLTPPKKKSPLRMYIDLLLTMFNILLIIAGILEYILLGVDFKDNFANTYLGGILIAVAFLNAFIEFFQLQKSEAILASFLAMIPPSCHVIRDGAITAVPAADLVKGDVVLLRTGDKTPADLIIFASTDLKVDNSNLTGESEAQERFALPDGSKGRPVEAENLVFNSTLVVNGEGWGVVVRTGDHTLIGHIAALTGGESGNKSPLAVEIGRFVLMVSAIAILFAVVFFIVGITTAYKGKVTQTFTFAVSILVAFVPEGLPSVVTLLLSIAAKRMAAQNVLVKDLQGVETLGEPYCLTLLATDKTGTLTRNQMTVTNLWNGTKMYSAFQSNNDSETTDAFTIDAPGMQEMIDISALNSRVKFDKTDIPFSERTILGDATETGLTRFAGRYIADYDGLHKQHPKVFEIPFNSSNKWALVILDKSHHAGKLTLYIKGAPERVLAKCSTYIKDGKEEPITDAFKASYDEAYNYMASRGHRVIACAQKLLPADEYDHSYPFNKNEGRYPSVEYCFCGLVSLEDPPKHGVREAIGTLRLAGIKGIYEDEVDAVVVHGDDIDGLQEGTTGCNADLGIAMNISGSDVSKEAANMILLDDNFASTVKGVAEGRQIFVNLKRSIQYTISHSTPEVIPQLLYVVVPIPLPLSAILILVIDLGFELFVALSFAWDKPEIEGGLMRMSPRRPVNNKSITSLKRRALRRTKTLRRDTETQEVIAPSRISVWKSKAAAPFSRHFWEDFFEQSDDERLVDSKLLSYSYLEAGVIEMLGALVSYFVVFYKSGFSPSDLRRAQSSSTEYFTKSSPDFMNSRGQVLDASKQVEAFGKAQSIVYLSVFIIQCFNVFAVKAKFSFPFGKSIVANYWNFAGILGGACLGIFIIYTPPLHVVFGGSYHLSPLYWLIPAAFGVLLLVWASIRVLLLRKGIEQARVKDIKGLMMFPTMRTMSMRSKH